MQHEDDADDIDQRLIAGARSTSTSAAPACRPRPGDVLQRPEKKKHADNPQTGFLRYAVISTRSPPFDNVDCRKAVQYAADKDAIQAACGGPLGRWHDRHDHHPADRDRLQEGRHSTASGADNNGDLAKAKEALDRLRQAQRLHHQASPSAVTGPRRSPPPRPSSSRSPRSASRPRSRSSRPVTTSRSTPATRRSCTQRPRHDDAGGAPTGRPASASSSRSSTAGPSSPPAATTT